ncbi:GNAT family N-acetyltransferase [Pseudoglutamicibacter albus]|uniref:GNAT family N-acetyltransferase n=1 Tax=Pseudoglutamicibacter albus TaxID=98671 RepID=UPI000C7590BD|nr:GNAT family N-acetyltransferase [Pseudoglutamicibacter albus]PKY79624.1 hypothetical protein CYJ35_09065 [Pseudoglutamicibacter albus]WIK83625.1 GNAT family N-acetyltransferase [Pseudoglutamicibacter albus]
MSTHLRALDLPEGLLAFVGNLRSMDAPTWAGISTLRQNVFIVEQECNYADQDLDDLEDTTEHLWVEDGAGVVFATLRIMNEKPKGTGLGLPLLGDAQAGNAQSINIFNPGGNASGNGAAGSAQQTKRIGRVAVHSKRRGQGIGHTLMKTAVARCGKRRIVLDAQSHLADWYKQFGFVVDGDEFLDVGIPHVPMVREAL